MPEPKSKKRKAAAAVDVTSLVDSLILIGQGEGSSAWEIKPTVMQATDGNPNLLHSLFITETFRKLLKQLDKSGKSASPSLLYGISPCKYKTTDGQMLCRPFAIWQGFECCQVADSKTVWALYKQGCTLQVHQPQRWEKPLADLCALMEQHLGCLVGINAYLTPPLTQGLAPHHDDVEIFVCQTEGSKRWRLYKPHKGFQLPNHPSGDLREEDLGEPVMDVTLKVGDILYMPRGTVHQAVAQEEASSHLTISTYQGFSFGVLAQAVLQTALEGQEEPVCMPYKLRRGLPWGFLYDHGLQADLLKQLQGTNKGATQSSSTAATKTAPKPDVAKLMAEGLRDLADKIEQQPQLLSRAADLMSMDFMDSRAPPAAVTLLPLGPEPTLHSAVQYRAQNAFRLVNMDPAQAPDVEEGLVKLVSSLSNSIGDHMMGQDDDDDGDHEHQHADGCCSHDHQHPHSHGHNAEGTHEHLNNGKHAKSAHDIENDEGDSSEDEENGTADLVYPAAYGPAVAEVLSACSTPLKVQDIKLPNAELQLNLAVSLWKEGVICVHTSKKSAKKARK